jgi:hypothetical protein
LQSIVDDGGKNIDALNIKVCGSIHGQRGDGDRDGGGANGFPGENDAIIDATTNG